jgi:hypothetical protein
MRRTRDKQVRFDLLITVEIRKHLWPVKHSTTCIVIARSIRQTTSFSREIPRLERGVPGWDIMDGNACA